MNRLISILFFLFLFTGSIQAFSQEQTAIPKADSLTGNAVGTKSEGGKKFNAGDLIFEHVVDNHEWHIVEIGNVEITIPLPVILLYKGDIFCFSSHRFHNETHSYEGFRLEQAGANKGKIIALEASGNPVQGSKVYDFSITKTVLAIFISAALLIWIFVSVANRYKSNRNKAPKGLQSLLEPLIIFVRDDIAKSSIGEKKYEKFMPFLLTIFFFIFFNNLFGLIPFFPGGANVTGNIAVTLVLAVFTFLITTISGNKHYWIDVINTPGVPWWLKFPIPLMPIVEIIGLITKPFVLMVRLFANITAGHIIALGFVSLIFIFGAISAALGLGVSVVSVIFMVFMDLLELLVGFIQAYVFTLLSALYFGLATVEPEHH
ncbi:MAG: F0F1 ATP synthase subunit A [Bacteroidales bacterium]|nr:F0F1 ATP synthase subunit A [Bacteroidales bacterium]MDD4602459.1 F0F1 ATP synthase subunit A [Bacteroidales bacterium]